MKEIKKFRLVPLSYAPTRLEALQDDLEKKMQDILRDETLTTSERLARYEDALKRKGNTLADEEERGEKMTAKQIPIIIPPPVHFETAESPSTANVPESKNTKNKTQRKVKQRISRNVTRKSMKRLVGRGNDSLEVVPW